MSLTCIIKVVRLQSMFGGNAWTAQDTRDRYKKDNKNVQSSTLKPQLDHNDGSLSTLVLMSTKPQALSAALT